MKLWQLLLIQALLCGVFLYFMFGSTRDHVTEDFLRDSTELKMQSKYPPPPPPPEPSKNATRFPPGPNNTNPPLTPDDKPKPVGFKGGSSVAMPSVNSTSIKGSAEEVKVIYKSSASSDGKSCRQINQRPVKLCKVGFVNNCKRYHVSEELSSWWMLSPIYTANNNQTEHLYDLHKNFRNYVKSFGINFQTVEVIFPGQEFALTEPNNEPFDLQYHADWIFAMRENLVNVGVRHLPNDWQYLSWIDQHIFWVDPYWFEKTILAFSHYNIVHMLNGNDFWNLKNTTDYYLEGFGRLWTEIGMGFERHDPRQCGLAWGMRREIFEKLGGLLDICIGTKCDLYQNYAYVGRRYTSQTSNPEYAEAIGKWQDHAIQVYDRKLGFVDTKVVHFMHCYGSCKTSDYNQQVWALMRYQFNPKLHILRDDEGRMSLVNNMPLALEMWRLYGGPPRQ